jgi:serine/threonine protein kinase
VGTTLDSPSALATVSVQAAVRSARGNGVEPKEADVVTKTKLEKLFDRVVAHLPLDALAHVSPEATITLATFVAARTPAIEEQPAPSMDSEAATVDICSVFWPEAASGATESIASLLSLVVVEGEGSQPGVDLELGETLGTGGMGQVKLGTQICLQRPVAIKMPHPHERRPERLQSLIREALVMGQVEHPNTVPVHQLGFDAEGQPVIVMKRIIGTEWRALTRDPSHPAWGALRDDADGQHVRHLEILIRVSQAISFAHAKGIIHRDIKPENVMIGDFGEVYLLDWGVAHQIGKSAEDEPTLRGTPAYMAPEMVEGEITDLDARTDVYLLGASLYEVVTGTAPHRAPNLYTTLFAAFNKPHLAEDDLGVPVELADILRKATARDMDARYPSAAALREALAEYLRHRNAITLTDESLQLLGSFEAAVAAVEGEGDLEAQHRPLFEQFSRCQTRFSLALRDWPDNPRATAGLQRCLEAMIEFGLLARLTPLVSSLLPQLPEPRPALQERAFGLQQSMKSALEAEAKLKALEHEQDIFISLRAKMVFAVLFAVAQIGVGVTVGHIFTDATGRNTVTSLDVLFVGLSFVIVLAAGVAIGWRWLSKNQASRRVMLGSVAVGVSLVLNRVLVWSNGRSVSEMMAQDLLLMGAISLVIAVVTHWWFTFSAVILLVGAALARLFPAFGLEIFVIIVSIAFWFVAAPLFSERLRRRVFPKTRVDSRSQSMGS